MFSSGATFLRICSRKLSLSWFICSMVSDATVRRSWPKMISLAISSICDWLSLRSLSAAAFMISGSVLTPTVKVEGTFMRMFCMESAFCRGMLMVMGVRLMKA